jgi:TetR/AcrR family transcriptional repressor of lmrAB and yxaGH operons
MARPRIADDDAVADRLSGVFREVGYDGASLSDLARAAGLRSASLYHRFPGGKAGMALAVLDHVERGFADVLAPLADEPDPADGVRRMAAGLATFYVDGRLSCVLDTMTLTGSPPEVRERATALARGWLDAMAAAAARTGAGPDEATRRARSALVLVEGALVVARVLDDETEFHRVLEALPDVLAPDDTTTDTEDRP